MESSSNISICLSTFNKTCLFFPFGIMEIIASFHDGGIFPSFMTQLKVSINNGIVLY